MVHSQQPNYRDNEKNDRPICSLYMITHLIIGFFAIYLSWKCNNGKFDLLSFLAAFFCPYFYIIWALATKGGCGVFEESFNLPQLSSTPPQLV